MTVDYKLMGKRLAKIRKDRGLTQEKLAEMTDLANNYISNIENNRSIPSLETLVRICAALEVTPNDILLGVSVNSSDYMTEELGIILKKCTPPERNLIIDFAELLISHREK